MDHNLDDSLNLEGDMGVDFEHTEDTVVSQGDMVLEHSGHEESIAMEFEHTEDQGILMDTGNEEIIVPDFMGDQFSLQEYSVQSDQTTGLTTIVESNQQHMLSSQGDIMIDQALQPQIMSLSRFCFSGEQERKKNRKQAMSPLRTSANIKKNDTPVLTTAPRQVAIAPKPPTLVAKSFTTNKQLAIAPKPVTVVANRTNSLVKKVSLASVMQSNTKGNAVFAQIGKQVIMVPSGSGSQKIKLMSGPVQYVRADSEQPQLITTKSVSGAQTKPVVTKLITVQGQPVSESKLLPAVAPRYVSLQPKSLPISLGNKVLVATPSKQPVKVAKMQEIIPIKSPATPKLLPAPPITASSSAVAKQKTIITTNTMQNVVLKPSPSTKTQVTNEASTIEGQRSQIHQINVPGKGIQYFRLVSNPAKPGGPKPLLALPSKTFMLSDGKGNLIQMSAEKIATGQPPSLVISGTQNTVSTKAVPAKGLQKLVRIAPVGSKATQPVTQAARSSQSLLVPLSPLPPPREDADTKSALRPQPETRDTPTDTPTDTHHDPFSDAPHDPLSETTHDFHIEYERPTSPTLENSSAEGIDQDSNSNLSRVEEHPLIVIPSNYDSSGMVLSDSQNTLNESQKSDSMTNMEGDTLSIYQSPTTPALSESDIVANTDLGLRPRKACNCTKSQCLKLYCDCFANGEFCNHCNCNNCHNNLKNEELRQKAIRGCLDRNPNAFRPKIGKAKIGGPDIIRRHNKGCNCKRSGCLKNYCECYEAKIACSSICKCVGCRNVEETLERRRRETARAAPPAHYRPPPRLAAKQPCSFMTTEVIEAVCQCLVAAADEREERRDADPVRDVIDEFARCLQDIIGAAHHQTPRALVEEGPA